MKSNFLFSLLLIITFYSAGLSQSVYFIKYKSSIPKEEIELKVSGNQIVPPGVQFQVNEELEDVNYLANGIIRKDNNLGRIIKLTFKDDIDESAVLQLQNLDSSIEYIQKANKYKLDFVPNDSLIGEQWALDKIMAYDAWDKTQGADTVLLGVIDTGIDYDHPDLQNKIYQNPGEIGLDNFGNDKRSNNIDDDDNGFIDDYRGWDFTDRVGFPFDTSGGDYLYWDNDPKDENGHGSFIAGIAGAQTNNISGIAGAAPNIKLVNLRAFDPAGYGEEDDVAAAILYAVQMGVKVINMSFGDNAFSLVLKDVIQFAYSKNVVLVGSAGNSGSPDPHYPSGYSEVICVGNSTIEDFVALNSNFGSTLDMVAPGTQILTTARNNNYSTINGTSASTPHVAATAALILSLQSFTNEEVKQILKSTTDDIGEAGWDIRSGAGRLNMFKALTVVAPSIIQFNFPRQDFATLDDTLVVNATVLSGLFSYYNLSYGKGLNPEDWTPLIENGLNQVSNEDIYTLELTNLPDTVYCLRLVVQLTNGRTLEERVNFFINRTPPIINLVQLSRPAAGPVNAFYGDRTTILAALYTDEPTITRMYYRRFGEVDFNFVTLDGFTINNQFVKYLHYGFIPKQLVEQNSAYEVYFEAENLVGLKTIDNNNGQNYTSVTNYDAEYVAKERLPFSLPAGSLFEDPVSITSNDLNEVYIRELSNSRVSSLYKLNNNNFELIDTLSDRIVRDFGDYNENGLKDLLTYFVRDGFIYEQQNQNSSEFNQKFSDETGTFWPVMAEDIDEDNVTEVVVVSSDTSAKVWKVNNDLTLSNPQNLYNFSDPWIGFNVIDSPNGVIADINNDGTDEIWFVDVDGDIFSHNILGPADYRPGIIITTSFFGSAAFIDAGDYNGDGIDELAVLLHSIGADIAPFYLLLVFNLVGDDLNILYEQVLVDAATEFTSSFQRSENSVRFADIDLDGQDELIVFVFPYAYIFKDFFGSDKIISYTENINSNSIFVGDLNFNNVPEVAFPTDQGIDFYEFAGSNKASTPFNLSGFSIDENTVTFKWQGSADQYNIYRGTSIENLSMIDSVFATHYTDIDLNTNQFYYYAVQALDLAKPDPYSNLSSALEIYSHKPGEVESVIPTSGRTITVKFTEKMSNTIENLQAFNLLGTGFPNSISPASQFSYLLTFNGDIPAGFHELAVSELRDFYGSPIDTVTVGFEMDSTVVSPEFFISSFNILDAYTVKLDFNLNIDESTFSNTDNYSFEPENKVTSISISNDKKSVTLNLKGQKPVGSIGREYVLRLTNVKSSAETGSIPINDGAGSFIVLTSFANDLSEVYVYPNPVNVSKNEGITFANLPRRAKITIWSISGSKINEIEENDGDGGILYNLKDSDGKGISSGVYFYRIVMLDEASDEKEEKLGKFAVIK